MSMNYLGFALCAIDGGSGRVAKNSWECRKVNYSRRTSDEET